MDENPIVARARRKADNEGIPFETALESIVKALPASERAMANVRDQPPEDTSRVFDVASQARLFKAGMMGTAVSVWSSYEGGYGPTRLEMKPDEPVIIRLVDEDIDDQIQFAGGYICGYIEALGGDLEKTKIWLELHDGQ